MCPPCTYILRFVDCLWQLAFCVRIFGAVDESVQFEMADSGGSGVKTVLFASNMSSAASYVQASKLFWLCPPMSLHICVRCVIFLTATASFLCKKRSHRIIYVLADNINVKYKQEYLYFQPAPPTCVWCRSCCFCCWCSREARISCGRKRTG